MKALLLSVVLNPVFLTSVLMSVANQIEADIDAFRKFDGWREAKEWKWSRFSFRFVKGLVFGIAGGFAAVKFGERLAAFLGGVL